MSSYYEKQWQEAMAGASLEPSAALWDKIEAQLDKPSGNRTWMTILLIAATVTLAMAFPLTIGNSSFEAQPKNFDFEVRQPVEAAPETLPVPITESTVAATSAPTPAVGPVIQDQPHTEPVVAEDQLVESRPATGVYHTATIKAGLEWYAYSLDQEPVPLDNYYLIPYYMPPSKNTNSGLLASVNMGAGSASAGNGFSLLSYQADMAMGPEALSEVTDARKENPGTTYYAGAGIELPMGKRWSFQAGLGYLSQHATGTSNMVFDNGNGYQPLSTYDPVMPGVVFLAESYDYKVTNGYLNVPLVIKYPFINRKVKFRAGVGLSTDFMIGHRVNTDAYGKVSYKPSALDYNPVALAGLVNLDVSYCMDNHYTVAFETGYRKGFTAIDELQSYYPSSFTMGLVLFYKLQ